MAAVGARGFWSQEVLNTIGLPPVSRDREDHVEWCEDSTRHARLIKNKIRVQS